MFANVVNLKITLVSRILPSRTVGINERKRAATYVAHSCNGRNNLSRARTTRYISQRVPDTGTASSSWNVGEHIGNHGYCTGSNTIHTANMDNVSSRPRGKSQYTYDADSNSR